MLSEFEISNLLLSVISKGIPQSEVEIYVDMEMWGSVESFSKQARKHRRFAHAWPTFDRLGRYLWHRYRSLHRQREHLIYIKYNHIRQEWLVFVVEVANRMLL